MIIYRLFTITAFVMLVESHYLSSSKAVPKFPKLTEFFRKKPDYKRKSKLSQCEVDIHKEQCIYRAFPRKQHCLVLKNIISELIPQYKVLLNVTELSNFRMLPVTQLYVNTCSKKVTFKTAAEAEFAIIPKVLVLRSVEAGIAIPIPLGDYQLFGVGEWNKGDMQMKVKFSKDEFDHYTVKGYSEIDLISVARIGEIFDVDVLPKGPITALLKNINMDTLTLRKCKVYGFVQPLRKNYELIVSGTPNVEEFERGHLRLFITKVGGRKNLALLLELQDYSPVTLLKNIYGPVINRISVLRDRNQTIALYVSSLPTANFSTTFTSRGSSRWIHRDSTFDPGAYLLVTLPFPKRKALDMKVQLFPDGLGFSLPENENLSGDLALGAILPEKIMHVGVDKLATHKNKDDEKYTRIKVLKFRYFIFNDTYLAAVESHLTDEEELAELMPEGRPDSAAAQPPVEFKFTNNKNRDATNLDAFFKREEQGKDDAKRDNIESILSTLASSNLPTEDASLLKLAQKAGALK